MEDRIRTYEDFQARFPDDEACYHYLIDQRWGEGFRCPECGNDRAYKLEARELWQCSRCKYQASVTARTVMHKTRLSFKIWFTGFFYLCTDQYSIAANALARSFKIPPKTAWHLMHRIRNALDRPEAVNPLSGIIELCTFEVEAVTVLPQDQAKVIAAVERRIDRSQGTPPLSPNRVRLRVVTTHSEHKRAMIPGVKDIYQFGSCELDPGSRLYIENDRLLGLTQPVYRNLEGLHLDQREQAQNRVRWILFDRVHRVRQQLRRWLELTFRKMVGRHLQRYLWEYSYRTSRWEAFKRGSLFRMAVHDAMHGAPLPFSVLVGRD